MVGDTILKPMIKYRGGKSKEISFFKDYFPCDYSRYVEPFLGGGAVFFYLNPRKAIVNDINPRLIQFYKSIKNNFVQTQKDLIELETLYNANQDEFLKRKLNFDGFVENKNESLYYKIRDMFNGKIPSNYSEGAIYYFINKTSYSGMLRYNSNGEYNVPFGRYKRLNTSVITTSHHLLLKRTQIYNVDFTKIFEKTKPDDFVFLDPPYDCTFTDYGNSTDLDFAEKDQTRLAQEYKNLSCKALLVIGKTKLTASLYKGLIRKEYKKNYSVNIRNRFKSEATHLVITNY